MTKLEMLQSLHALFKKCGTDVVMGAIVDATTNLEGVAPIGGEDMVAIAKERLGRARVALWKMEQRFDHKIVDSLEVMIDNLDEVEANKVVA